MKVYESESKLSISLPHITLQVTGNKNLVYFLHPALERVKGPAFRNPKYRKV